MTITNYNWLNIGETAGNTLIIYNNTHGLDTTLLVDKQYYTVLPIIIKLAGTLSSMLCCRIFRDATGSLATDNYANDAGILEIDFHYQIDDRGSTLELVK